MILKIRKGVDMGVVQTMVRISEIELKGFKNTQYGRIIMPSAGNKDFFSQKQRTFLEFMARMVLEKRQ